MLGSTFGGRGDHDVQPGAPTGTQTMLPDHRNGVDLLLRGRRPGMRIGITMAVLPDRRRWSGGDLGDTQGASGQRAHVSSPLDVGGWAPGRCFESDVVLLEQLTLFCVDHRAHAARWRSSDTNVVGRRAVHRPATALLRNLRGDRARRSAERSVDRKARTHVYTRDELRAFIDGAKAGEFDHLLWRPGPRRTACRSRASQH